MKATTLTLAKPQSEPAGSWLDRLTRRALLRRLQSLRHGSLVIEEGGEKLHFGDGRAAAIRVQVLDPSFYRELVLGGSIGAELPQTHNPDSDVTG